MSHVRNEQEETLAEIYQQYKTEEKQRESGDGLKIHPADRVIIAAFKYAFKTARKGEIKVDSPLHRDLAFAVSKMPADHSQLAETQFTQLRLNILHLITVYQNRENLANQSEALAVFGQKKNRATFLLALLRFLLQVYSTSERIAGNKNKPRTWQFTLLLERIDRYECFYAAIALDAKQIAKDNRELAGIIVNHLNGAAGGGQQFTDEAALNSLKTLFNHPSFKSNQENVWRTILQHAVEFELDTLVSFLLNAMKSKPASLFSILNPPLAKMEIQAKLMIKSSRSLHFPFFFMACLNNSVTTAQLLWGALGELTPQDEAKTDLSPQQTVLKEFIENPEIFHEICRAGYQDVTDFLLPLIADPQIKIKLIQNGAKLAYGNGYTQMAVQLLQQALDEIKKLPEQGELLENFKQLLSDRAFVSVLKQQANSVWQSGVTLKDIQDEVENLLLQSNKQKQVIS